MKQKEHKQLHGAVVLASLLLLAACQIPLTGENVPTREVEPTLEPTDVETSTSTVIPTAISIPTVELATETPAAASPAQPIPTAAAPVSAPPEISGLFVTILQQTEAREGPGDTFAPAYTLKQGTVMPVLGRSMDGLWWAIPGPGDGPGPQGWVRAADVVLSGNTNGIPVIAAPGQTAFPVYVDPGSAPANVCVANPLASGLGPVLIRLGPGEQFNATFQLGSWAEVLKTEMNWHMVLLGPGDVGWVDGRQVQLSGPCP